MSFAWAALDVRAQWDSGRRPSPAACLGLSTHRIACRQQIVRPEERLVRAERRPEFADQLFAVGVEGLVGLISAEDLIFRQCPRFPLIPRPAMATILAIAVTKETP